MRQEFFYTAPTKRSSFFCGAGQKAFPPRRTGADACARHRRRHELPGHIALPACRILACPSPHTPAHGACGAAPSPTLRKASRGAGETHSRKVPCKGFARPVPVIPGLSVLSAGALLPEVRRGTRKTPPGSRRNMPEKTFPTIDTAHKAGTRPPGAVNTAPATHFTR